MAPTFRFTKSGPTPKTAFADFGSVYVSAGYRGYTDTAHIANVLT